MARPAVMPAGTTILEASKIIPGVPQGFRKLMGARTQKTIQMTFGVLVVPKREQVLGLSWKGRVEEHSNLKT